jgi:Fe-S-cluster containining protein
MARQGDGAQLSENGPLELPLVDLPSAHPCYGCAACCRYVAVELDPPTVPRDYDQIHWYLTHRDVSVYIDWEGDWYVEFKTRCEHLTEAATCAAYRDRPELCSDFSVEECEKTTQEPAHREIFTSFSEFLEWFQRKRPRAFERYMSFRRGLLGKRERESKGDAAHPPGRGSTASTRGSARKRTRARTGRTTTGVQSSTSI